MCNCVQCTSLIYGCVLRTFCTFTVKQRKQSIFSIPCLCKAEKKYIVRGQIVIANVRFCVSLIAFIVVDSIVLLSLTNNYLMIQEFCWREVKYGAYNDKWYPFSESFLRKCHIIMFWTLLFQCLNSYISWLWKFVYMYFAWWWTTRNVKYFLSQVYNHKWI